jgi:mono/diheme cytochrome c family protein
MKCALITLSAVSAVVIVGALVAISQFSLSALPEPASIENYLATSARRLLVRRGSREAIPPAPANMAASIEEGDKLYGTECAACHGLDGNNPTDAGRWMYPRAADLKSREVQQYSDRELFWIVKNGIRLSGMPAFGNVETDEHIWNLVHFVRTLPASASPKDAEAKP